MFGSLGGGPPGGAGSGGPNPFGGGDGMPDFQKIMAQMMGLDPNATPPNLLGDMDDPAGLGGAPPNPFAGLGGGGPNGMPDLSALGGLGGLGGMPGFGAAPKRSKVDKYWGLVHFVAVLLLAAFAIVWWEPFLRAARSSRIGSVVATSAGVSGWAGRWARLAGGRGVVRVIKDEFLGGIEVIVSGIRY